MVDTNKDLRNQRELINDANAKVQQTDAQVNKTGKLVDQMTRKEYCKKLELPNKDRFQIKVNLRRMEERDFKEVLRLYNLEN